MHSHCCDNSPENMQQVILNMVARCLRFFNTMFSVKAMVKRLKHHRHNNGIQFIRVLKSIIINKNYIIENISLKNVNQLISGTPDNECTHIVTIKHE